jgi:hypothetical protein
MKESTARTKFCPHFTKSHNDANTWCCIGSDCMMWEAEFKREEIFITENEEPPKSDQTWRKGRLDKVQGQQWFRWNPGPDGTCGLITKECEH